ncbi:MAG TPA: hypothetical protein VLY24_19425 [Bryobacteraceae bacterium]|nr:hypothetical protein [Bryobacteraceae bacterium]
MRLLGLLAAAGVACAQDLPRGQIIADVKCTADPTQSYALYLPSNYTPDRAWKVLFAFDPGARGRLPVERYQAPAERYGYIVAGSNNSRNGPWDRSFAAADAMWSDVFSRFSIDERRVYATGLSGGSRVALAVALRTGRIAGVIASSAGFPDAKPRTSVPFAIFETAGVDDFNNLEMRDVNRPLTSPHHLAIFEGGHEWPPAAVAAEAVDWLEIQAMRAGLRERDETLIGHIFETYQARSASAPDTMIRYRVLNALAADFAGLRDVTWITQEAAGLQQSKEYRDASKKERELEQSERRRRAELEQLVAGLVADPAVRRSNLDDLKPRLTDIARQARAPQDSSERQMARRLLGEVMVESREIRDNELQELLEKLRTPKK